MTATTTFTAPETATAHTAPTSGTTKQLWKTGGVAGLVAAVATSTTAGVARAFGVSLDVSGKAIPVLGFAQLTFFAAIIGTVIAVVLARRATRPQRTFVTTTIALSALSIVPDVLADAHATTRFTLALTHIVAAAIVIPALASRLHTTN
jgi:peptidoglycan/LPS O-acetylase OafA/YrhL